MHSTLNPEQTDPRNVYTHVNEEIARAYEQIASADKQISKLARDDARQPSDRPPTRMNTFRPGVRGGRAVRGVTALMLTALICVAAIVWQSSYGNTAREIIAKWVPQLVASSQPLQNPGLPEQPSPPTVQASAANAAPPQPATQTAPEGVAPTAAALSPESAQLLQSTARDLANAEQDIEQLKAGIALLNASVEQLKASQEQMSRDVAKVSQAKASEPNLRPKTSALPPRPAAAPPRKPPQAAAAPTLRQAAVPSVQPRPKPQATAQPVPIR
jgi:cytoskeletal protein RodZ